jgi:cytochrome P450
VSETAVSPTSTGGPDKGEAHRGCPAWVRELDLLHNPEAHRDPYPLFEQLRSECPVAWIEGDGGYWLVTKYADIHGILRDPARFSNHKIRPLPAGAVHPREDMGRNLLIQSDAPEHMQFRSVVQKVFTPATAKMHEAGCRILARELAEGIKARGECEFVRDFAIHIPAAVMLPAIGVPEEDRAALLEAAWGDEQSFLAEDPYAREQSVKATRARQVAYYRDLIRARQESGAIGDDLISTLVEARIDGEPLSEDDMVNLVLVIYNAALHTTAHTLSNIMVYLSQHPDDRDRLTREPALIPLAIEELMRWETIVTNGRVVTEDVEVDGRELRAGEMVLLSLGSASRDPAEMGPHADEVDFDRGPTRHLQFGAGPHRCLGSHLARMELRVALEEIHRAIPSYRLKPGTVPVRHTGQQRGTEELWLVV